jgi:hypothetical protein
MSLASTLFDVDALRAAEDGFELDIHLNWYRSLPLSSVKTLELTVDGEAVDRADIAFALNGNEYSLDELQQRWDELWYVLDPATLRVSRPLVRKGHEADVSLRLGSRIPYIVTGPDHALEVVSERSAKVVAR